MAAPTVKEKLDCAQRELALRRRVYPKWVDKGKMTEYQATREIQLMTAIVEDYQRQLVEARGQTKMDL